MKDEEFKIESLKIKLGSKTIELEIDDAKKLYTALENLFKKEVIRREICHGHDWLYRPWSITYSDNIINRATELPKLPYVVTCNSDQLSLTIT